MKKLMTQAGLLQINTLKYLVAGLFVAFIIAAPFNTVMAQASQEPVVSESFAALSGTALTLTNSTVTGDVGVDVGGVVTLTTSSVIGTVHEGDAVAVEAYSDFLDVYEVFASETYPCTGSLNTVYTDETLTLTPGVYCSDAAVTFTRTVLTLDAQGDENAVWIFKIGTLGTGALTGTGLSVVMANDAQPCNVYWWVAQATTLTTSNTKGTILAGAAVTFTGGSLIGQILAEAGVTMTGADLLSCGSLNVVDPPVIDEDTCEEICEEFCEDSWKEPKDCNCKKDYKKNKDCKGHKDCNKHDTCDKFCKYFCKDFCKEPMDCKEPKDCKGYKDCKKHHDCK